MCLCAFLCVNVGGWGLVFKFQLDLQYVLFFFFDQLRDSGVAVKPVKALSQNRIFFLRIRVI